VWHFKQGLRFSHPKRICQSWLAPMENGAFSSRPDTVVVDAALIVPRKCN